MGLLSLLLLTTTALALATALPVAAVTVVSCKDKDGSTFFADRCPPGASKMGEKEVRGGPRRDADAALAEIAKANPVVLYLVPDCDACDLVRQQLKTRNVPFTAKDVGPDHADNQEELKTVGKGNMTVPTVAVGTRTFTGYNRASLELGLDEAGYPARTTAAAPAAPAQNDVPAVDGTAEDDAATDDTATN